MTGGDPEKDVIYFARADFRGTGRLFGIRRNDRRQHTYVIGKTGTGKSALLNNMIIQDVVNGEGVCVVDPHGELVEGIIEKIPEDRKKDIIYFNPADTDYHIGFNVLELPDPKYKHLVASGLMGIFTKIWANVWSARMEYIMNNAILALLDTPNSTLLGILRILVDKEFRQKIIAKVEDPVVRSFWVHEYEEWQDKFRNEAIAPIQNKVGQFLSTSLIRNVVGQSKSTVDIFDIMNTGKIFLVNVSKGRIGEDNSALLGAMLITKIQLSAMERVRIPENERVDFYLYVDEFQNFATDSFAGVLSEARKYRLNLILAHQYVGQLVTDVSTKVRDAIFGNVGTMIVFRVGALDAEFLEPEFEPEFTIMDIVNLPNYHIYLKLMVGGVTSRPFSAGTLPPFKMQGKSIPVNDIIEYSRKRYARPRDVVEEEIKKWIGTSEGMEGLAGSDSGGSGARTGSKPDLAGPGFQVTCSSCGLETKVPFEPDPGRPVYCKDCLDKIKAGTMQPVRRKVKAETGPKADTSSLALLGIEFKPGEKPEKKEVAAQPGTVPSRPSSRAPTVHGRRERPGPGGQKQPDAGKRASDPQPERRASILEGAEDVPLKKEDKKESAEPLSLADLGASESKPRTKKEHVRPKVNVDELRQAIAESLGKDDGEDEEA